MNSYEFTCESCGIRVIQFVPPPPETVFCAQCRFLESIDDPAAKAEAERFLNRQQEDDSCGNA